MLGSFVALGILSNLHERPSLETVIGWIDFETCGLLFGVCRSLTSLTHKE
jgi:hypothetical protein